MHISKHLDTLICASISGDEKTVRHVLSQPDLDVSTLEIQAFLRSACMNATYFGHVNVLSMILEKCPCDLRVLAQIAAKHDQLDVLRFLRERSTECALDIVALERAVCCGTTRIVEYLRNEAPSLQIGGRGLLETASEKGFDDVVNLLLDWPGFVPTEDEVYGAGWGAAKKNRSGILLLLIRRFPKAGWRRYDDNLTKVFPASSEVDGVVAVWESLESDCEWAE